MFWQLFFLVGPTAQYECLWMIVTLNAPCTFLVDFPAIHLSYLCLQVSIACWHPWGNLSQTSHPSYLWLKPRAGATFFNASRSLPAVFAALRGWADVEGWGEVPGWPDGYCIWYYHGLLQKTIATCITYVSQIFQYIIICMYVCMYVYIYIYTNTHNLIKWFFISYVWKARSGSPVDGEFWPRSKRWPWSSQQLTQLLECCPHIGSGNFECLLIQTYDIIIYTYIYIYLRI